MKLKYYLRGLGIGIIVTALLMSYSDSKASDWNTGDEIPEVQTLVEEAGTEEEKSSETEQTTGQTQSQGIEQICSEGQTETESEEMSEAGTEESSEMIEAITQQESVSEMEKDMHIPAVTVEADAQESYLLNVVRGDDSGTVSRKLQNAGIIENASEFDAFLMQHGYDKRISVGTVEIPLKSTWVEIAEKIAGK